MPLISRVGRRHPRARLAIALVYCVLAIGAVTTVYPFLVMAGLGLKGASDQNGTELVAPYLTDDRVLLAKHLLDKHGGQAARAALYQLGDAGDAGAYEEWLGQLPPERWLAGYRTASGQVTSRLNLAWQDWLRARYGTIERVNREYQEVQQILAQIAPPAELLERPGWQSRAGAKWRDWMEFKQTLPPRFRIPILGRTLWQEHLRREFKGQFGEVPPRYRGGAGTFEELSFPEPRLRSGDVYLAFLARGVPQGMKGAIPETLGAPLAVGKWEREFASEHAGEIRGEFASRNYRYVLTLLAGSGRVLWNTFLFCSLAVLVQLVVNPVCAYALSRFPMRAGTAVLLFLLATMAFPAEVAMIPSFLLLRDLGLLNTYAALVLPTAANGFMIFLLKGFFDSLPREIFESGQIDGAPEWVMMLRLALPLSRPVLGYLALLAFMGAYGAFMFAFLVVQKREMWTLMVQIFQMQGYAPKAVMMAALTLAAAPTIIVFLAAQNVIMRGIVLPSEK
jgi:multiple sugar transport system permease protein